MENLLDRGLPKWPQMLVTGAPIAQTQALEIIRRTDNFFSFPHGNDHAFVEEAIRLIGFPKEPVDPRRKGSDPKAEEKFFDALNKFWENQAQWKEDWGHLGTQYVRNDWVSSCFISGPHGWCHPDGTISFADNVGKWPSVEEIKNDWEILAKAFPFLEVEITLMNKESCEEDSQPVVSGYSERGDYPGRPCRTGCSRRRRADACRPERPGRRVFYAAPGPSGARNQSGTG